MMSDLRDFEDEDDDDKDNLENASTVMIEVELECCTGTVERVAANE